MSRNRSIRFEIGLLAALLLFLVHSLPIRAEEEAEPGEPADTADPWGPLKLLVGGWGGEIEGKLGQGRGVRRYEFGMGGHFLICRHNSVRLPQEESPKGDQHEELGVFSYDSERKTIVYREFMMNEGVMVRSPCQIDGMKVVCASEAVESGPGIRTRLTLEIIDRYHFSEVYELAWSPEKELELYFTNRWTRAPTLNE